MNKRNLIIIFPLAIFIMGILSCVSEPEMAKKDSRVPPGMVAVVGRIVNSPRITQDLKTLGEAYQSRKTLVALSLSPDANTRPMYLDTKGGVIIPATWGEWFIVLVPKDKPIWFQRGEVALAAEGGSWHFGVLDPSPAVPLIFEASDEIVYIGDLFYHVEETDPVSGKTASYIEVKDSSTEAMDFFSGYMQNTQGDSAKVTVRLLAHSRIPLAVSTYGYKTVIEWR